MTEVVITNIYFFFYFLSTRNILTYLKTFEIKTDAMTERLFLMTEDATMLHNAADNIYYEQQQQKSRTNTIWRIC